MEVSTICMLRKTGIRCMIPDDGRYYEPCTSCLEGCLYEDEDDKNANSINSIYSITACLNKVYKTFNYVRYCKNHYYKMKAICKEKAREKADYIKENYVLCGFHMEKYDWKEELKVLHFISKTKLNKHKITTILENDELNNDNNDNNYDEYDLDVWPMDKHYKYLKNDIQHNYRYMSTSNNSDDDTSSDDTSNKKINLKDNDDLIVENMY